jgi:hypothetical protein
MTVLELLLDNLPTRYVDAIVNNMFDRKSLYKEASCIEAEMLTLFDWEQSKEGYDFWDKVLTAIIEHSVLPKLPIQIKYAPSTWIMSETYLYIMNSFDTGINVSFEVDFTALRKSQDSDKKEKILSILN